MAVQLIADLYGCSDITDDMEEIKNDKEEKNDEDIAPVSKETKKVNTEKEVLEQVQEQPVEKKSFFDRFKKNKKDKEKV